MSDTHILHIETSTKVCSVALSKNGKLLHAKESHDDQYAHGEKLTLFIEEVMKEAKLTFQDLSAVSVASGPGSYTGLRIGVSTAKGLCYALHIPLLSVDSLTSLHELARKKYPTKEIGTMLDARRMEVYSTIYDKVGSVAKPIAADVLDEESYSEFKDLVVVGDANEKLKELWSARSVEFDDEVKPSAIGQIEITYEKFQKEDFEDVAYFEPYYLKAFFTPAPKKKA